MSTKRLTRSNDNRMLAGVCGGLGEYFNVDPTLIRLGLAFLFFVGAGSPFLVYLLLWLIVPEAGRDYASPSDTLSAGVDEIANTARQFGEEVRNKVEQVRSGESAATAPSTDTPTATPAATAQAEPVVEPEVTPTVEPTAETEPEKDVVA